MVLWVVLFGIIILSIVMSLVHMFSPRDKKKSVLFISKETLILLLLVYATLVVSFGLIYSILHMNSFPILIEGGKVISAEFPSVVLSSIYFSAVTMLTVGYGDITPIGIGRAIASFQALIGYIMPAAFVVRIVLDMEHREE
ncbi:MULTISPECIES: potassium channel family protein [Bacillus]|uniref:potassium channel family protein n=1 Tax=Bacillus TaxID=1386 RepID=UPI000BB6A7A7|nr:MULTISPECIES: potassium channel family protein [Bacillus]